MMLVSSVPWVHLCTHLSLLFWLSAPLTAWLAWSSLHPFTLYFLPYSFPGLPLRGLICGSAPPRGAVESGLVQDHGEYTWHRGHCPLPWPEGTRSSTFPPVPTLYWGQQLVSNWVWKLGLQSSFRYEEEKIINKDDQKWSCLGASFLFKFYLKILFLNFFYSMCKV